MVKECGNCTKKPSLRLGSSKFAREIDFEPTSSPETQLTLTNCGSVVGLGGHKFFISLFYCFNNGISLSDYGGKVEMMLVDVKSFEMKNAFDQKRTPLLTKMDST